MCEFLTGAVYNVYKPAISFQLDFYRCSYGASIYEEKVVPVKDLKGQVVRALIAVSLLLMAYYFGAYNQSFYMETRDLGYHALNDSVELDSGLSLEVQGVEQREKLSFEEGFYEKRNDSYVLTDKEFKRLNYTFLTVKYRLESNQTCLDPEKPEMDIVQQEDVYPNREQPRKLDPLEPAFFISFEEGRNYTGWTGKVRDRGETLDTSLRRDSSPASRDGCGFTGYEILLVKDVIDLSEHMLQVGSSDYIILGEEKESWLMFENYVSHIDTVKPALFYLESGSTVY